MTNSSTITRYRGDTVPDRYVISDDDGIADISTGYAFRMTLNSEQNPADDSNQLFQIDGTITNGAGGIVDFPFTDPQSRQPPGTYYFDVVVTYPDNSEKTIDKGKYVFKQRINKT